MTWANQINQSLESLLEYYVTSIDTPFILQQRNTSSIMCKTNHAWCCMTVRPSCFSYNQPNVTKPRLEGKDSLAPFMIHVWEWERLYHCHCCMQGIRHGWQQHDKDGTSTKGKLAVSKKFQIINIVTNTGYNTMKSTKHVEKGLQGQIRFLIMQPYFNSCNPYETGGEVTNLSIKWGKKNVIVINAFWEWNLKHDIVGCHP